MRQCGNCQLCCRLLPVRSVLLDKNAGEKCRFQKFHVGCTVYNTSRMPGECGLWNCRWLVNDDTADLSRPDRTHYVIDLMPDFVEAQDHDSGKTIPIQVVQIWCDPKYPDAWRDPDLLAYLERRGCEGKAALIRYNARDGFVVMPPAMCSDGEFHDMREQGVSLERTHTPKEIMQALGNFSFVTTTTEN